MRQLGDLPYDRDRQGRMNLPTGGLLFEEWKNRYTASLYPFVATLVAQIIIPANPRRAYVLIQNKDAVNDLLVNFGQKPTAFNGVIIAPRGNYEFVGGSFGGAFVPSNSVWVLGTAATQDGVLVEGVLPVK